MKKWTMNCVLGHSNIKMLGRRESSNRKWENSNPQVRRKISSFVVFCKPHKERENWPSDVIEGRTLATLKAWWSGGIKSPTEVGSKFFIMTNVNS